MSDETLIFLHIPKTAGTTMRSIMLRQYRDGEVCGIYKHSPVHMSEDSFKSLDDEVKRKCRGITGHVSYGIHDILPAGQKYAYVTILREPVKRVLSLCNHLAKRQFKDKEHEIEDFFVKYRHLGVDNGQVRLLSGMKAEFGRCTEEMLEQAMRNLSKFSLVGITEAFPETLFLAARVLGWKPMAYESKNINSYPPNLSPNAVDENIMDLIRRHNGLDLRLYEYARNLFRERLEGVGPDWESRLEEFKKEVSDRKSSEKELPLEYVKEKILVLGSSLSLAKGSSKRLIKNELHKYYWKYYKAGKKCGADREKLRQALSGALRMRPLHYKTVRLFYHMLFG